MKASDFQERLKTTGRNDDCPCGSGKKYKKCHLLADEEAQQEALKKQNEAAEEKADTGSEKSAAPQYFDSTKSAKINRQTNAPRFKVTPRTTGK